ncbi:hypothetical protein GCM10027589_39280 [Actinocorallia lasiicapitis]
MPAPAPSHSAWRKSSYSNGAGGECVELAPLASYIGVRDSKRPTDTVLRFTPNAWRDFAEALRAEVGGR